MVLEQTVVNFGVHRPNLARQVVVLSGMPGAHVLETLRLIFQRNLNVSGVGVRIFRQPLRLRANAGWEVEQLTEPPDQAANPRHHQPAIIPAV